MTLMGPIRIRRFSSLREGRRSASFTAGRWAAKRYPFNVSQLVYNPGNEHDVHLRFTGQTRRAGGYRLGIFRKNEDGSLASLRWEKVGRVRGADFLIGTRTDGDDLVFQYLTGKYNIPLDGLSDEAQRDFQTLRPHIHHATIDRDGKLVVHYQHRESGKSLGTKTYDIPVRIPRLSTIFQDKDNPGNEYHVRLCTERLSGRGVEVLSREPGYFRKSDLVLYTDKSKRNLRWDQDKQDMIWEALVAAGCIDKEGKIQEDFDQKIKKLNKFILLPKREKRELLDILRLQVLPKVDRGGIIKDYQLRFYLRVCTYAESRIKGGVRKYNIDPEMDEFTVIRQRAEVQVEHADGFNNQAAFDLDALESRDDVETRIINGREIKIAQVDGRTIETHRDPDEPSEPPKVVEWLPYNQKIQHFPHLVNTDPRYGDPFMSCFTNHSLDTVVAPQHLVEEYPDLAQGWCKRDQADGFFGEYLRGLLAHPYGGVRGLETPWWMPQGAYSLQYSKSLLGAAICTGNGAVIRAPYDLLFDFEELGHPAPFVSTLLCFRTITEDAQKADESQLFFGLETRMRRDVTTVGSSVDAEHPAEEQRWRWAAEIGYYLSWGLKFLKDEVIRCRFYGKLSIIPGPVGKFFANRNIPSLYTKDQFLEWLRVGSWYLDTLCKYTFAILSLTYMLGFTPLAATVMFAALWFANTAISWPAYSYQVSKMGVPWSLTFLPIPKDIFIWNLMVPYIGRGVLHQEDKATGPFKPTETIGGLQLPHYAKRHLLGVFIATPLATTALGIVKMSIYGIKFGILMNTIWPAFIGFGTLLAVRWLIKQHRVFVKRGKAPGGTIVLPQLADISQKQTPEDIMRALLQEGYVKKKRLRFVFEHLEYTMDRVIAVVTRPDIPRAPAAPSLTYAISGKFNGERENFSVPGLSAEEQNKVFALLKSKKDVKVETWGTFLIQGSGIDPFFTDAWKWLKGKL